MRVSSPSSTVIIVGSLVMMLVATYWWAKDSFQFIQSSQADGQHDQSDTTLPAPARDGHKPTAVGKAKALTETENDDSFSVSSPAAAKQPIAQFRGDWGETPVYGRHDQVHFQNGLYQSLQKDNQNQPPDVSPDYWQFLQPLKSAQAAWCLAPQAGADLSQCDFSEAVSLKDRNLPNTQLSKTRLSGELGSANLSGADMSEASVIGSLVISADTRLQGANLSKLQSDGNNPVISEGADMSQVDLSAANLYGAKFKDSNLQQAQLTGATLTGAELTASRFEGAEMTQSNLSYTNLSQSGFSGAVLVAADISEANLTQTDFNHSNLQQANLAGSELTGADLSGADLRGANLTGVKGSLSAVIDGQTNFSDAICPDGVAVDGKQVLTCLGHGF